MSLPEVIVVISTFLAIEVLGFSIFASIYSNLTHNAEMADGNALQGNEISILYWRKLSNKLRGLARSRAYSANWCFWGLVASIITLATQFCLIAFSISIIFLCIALALARFDLTSKKFGKRLLSIPCPINPNVKRLTIAKE